ncbi:aminotransferase class I/II-fold pyridoxal phosphate-dependent enzyme [Kitasatospora sp. MAP5-34]|uniref:aminotransferase class I/II-fold pyridoxal phosphate-dependent enzyme n=1 Tax=Kitasatospora sp. MAP5-34 TaxID=3035102 RepID=UPI002472F5CA|nr:aminotransferase class I/II-fold pyridoxal phosphate-dependent enzyme [Kitasatospora sp. MAP5-34]MDH6576496.1 7-keto-8-aminopelargonate synthetase-like enzyme [Kitasatospora sp. MAP5-34]
MPYRRSNPPATNGDTSPAGAIFDLAEKYNALTFLDETHSIGVRGATGAGLSEELGNHRATFIQGVFGKAIGTVGGYVVGPDAALDYVRSFAPGFIFTTSLPQTAMEATLKSLETVQAGVGLRAELYRKTAFMKAELRARNIDFIGLELTGGDTGLGCRRPGQALWRQGAAHVVTAAYVKAVTRPSASLAVVRPTDS